MKRTSLRFGKGFHPKLTTKLAQAATNVYVPPAYTADGDELPRGKP